MMETLRNGAKSWVAKILLGLLVASFAVWGITDVFRGFQNADLVTVGGNPISSETFRVDLNRAIQQFNQQTGQSVNLEEARKLGIDKQVLDRLISQASLEAQARKMGISVGDSAAMAGIQNEAIFKDASGKFDLSRFRILLQQNGLTESGYLSSTKTEMQRRAISSLAGAGITLPTTLQNALVRYGEETRDGSYVTFAVSDADVPAPNDADIKSQYESSPAAYTAPEYRSVVVLKVEPSDMASKIQVSDSEIKDAYDTFKEEYFIPEKRDVIQLSFKDKAAAEKAKQRLDAGEDILKIASENGQKETDVTFKDKLKSDFLDEKIAEAAFAIKESEVSPPVVGSLNTAILKATKVNASHQPTLAELSDKLKQRIQLQKAREEIQSVYDAVEDARAQQTRFEDIGAKAGIPVLVIPAVSAAGTDKAEQPVALPAAQELLKAVFSSDVGLENDALSVNDGYVWYDVREVIPSAVRPLDSVKAKVTSDWKATKLRSAASEKAKSTIEKAGTNTKLETIAAELSSAVKTVTGIKRSSVSEEFDGLATLALFSVPDKALTWSLEGDGKSARIIQVTKISLPTSLASTSAQDVTNTAKRGLGGDLAAAFLLATTANTEVVRNEELWRQISGNTPSQ